MLIAVFRIASIFLLQDSGLPNEMERCPGKPYLPSPLGLGCLEQFPILNLVCYLQGAEFCVKAVI